MAAKKQPKLQNKQNLQGTGNRIDFRNSALLSHKKKLSRKLLNISILVSRGRCYTGGILALLEYLAALVGHQPLHAKHREQVVRSSWLVLELLSNMLFMGSGKAQAGLCGAGIPDSLHPSEGFAVCSVAIPYVPGLPHDSTVSHSWDSQTGMKGWKPFISPPHSSRAQSIGSSAFSTGGLEVLPELDLCPEPIRGGAGLLLCWRCHCMLLGAWCSREARSQDFLGYTNCSASAKVLWTRLWGEPPSSPGQMMLSSPCHHSSLPTAHTLSSGLDRSHCQGVLQAAVGARLLLSPPTGWDPAGTGHQADGQLGRGLRSGTAATRRDLLPILGEHWQWHRVEEHVCPEAAGPLLLPVLPSQAAGPNSASTGKGWEQSSELQRGVYWSRDVYCIQNLADPLFLWVYPVVVGFASPFAEGEAVQPSSLGTALLRFMQCTCVVHSSVGRACSLPGASSDHSHPGAGPASGFTSCLFDLAPRFPSCVGGILQAVHISGDATTWRGSTSSSARPAAAAQLVWQGCSLLNISEGQRQNPPLEGQKPSKIQAKQMLPAALPEYLSLGWPEPSTGKAVVRCCERVPKPSVLRSHPQLVASWISPQHHSPGTALSSPQPRAPAVPTHGQERMAPSRQRREEGLNNCCFAGLSPLLAEKGTLLPSRYQPSPSNPLGNCVAEKLSHLIQICFRPTAAW
ncbi:uncharacterized protein ACIBXB_021527 [Morphnus guianensis]